MTAKTGTVRTYVAVAGLLAFGALFASLANWQWRRAEESRATRALFDDGSAGGALAALPDKLAEDERFKRVEVRGEYVGRPQFLLDNMLHDGVAGYHVLTALRLPGGAEHVLVNRGWVPAGDRRVLPDVAVAAGPRRVTGRLERLPRPGLRLGSDEAATGAAEALVLQFPTAGDLAGRLGEPVLDYQVLLDVEAPEGYVREWRAPGVEPERHLAYAGQWFALAIGAAAAGLVMAYRTTRRKP